MPELAKAEQLRNRIIHTGIDKISTKVDIAYENKVFCYAKIKKK